MQTYDVVVRVAVTIDVDAAANHRRIIAEVLQDQIAWMMPEDLASSIVTATPIPWTSRTADDEARRGG